jgi:hypothetical protein
MFRENDEDSGLSDDWLDSIKIEAQKDAFFPAFFSQTFEFKQIILRTAVSRMIGWVLLR